MGTHVMIRGKTSNTHYGEECDSMTFSLGNLASKHLPYRSPPTITKYLCTRLRTIVLSEYWRQPIYPYKGLCLKKAIAHTNEVVYSQTKNEQDLYELTE